MDVILNGCRGIFLQIKLWECRNTLCISNNPRAEMEEKDRQAGKIPSKEMFPRKRKKRKARSLPLRFFLP